MKRFLILIALMLIVVFADGVLAQEATQEAPVVSVVNPDVTTVYVEVLPVWVLPGFGVLLAVVGLLIYTNYKQGIHLKDMISEKAFASLLGIVRDVAKDIARRTPNTLDDAIVNGLLPDEPSAVVNVNVATPEKTPG